VAGGAALVAEGGGVVAGAGAFCAEACGAATTTLSAVCMAAGSCVGGEEAVPSGIVYLRTDRTAAIEPYVGQTTIDRFVQRQGEHNAAHLGSDFEYAMLGRAEPGTQLDRLEEFYIRGYGGPGALSNKRHQMNPLRYLLSGGDPYIPGMTLPRT